LILDSVFFTGSSLENILENFVEPELAEALSTISNQSWEPALNSVLVSKSKIPWKLSKVILGRSHLRLFSGLLLLLTRVKPVRPSAAIILPKPSPMLEYIFGLA